MWATIHQHLLQFSDQLVNSIWSIPLFLLLLGCGLLFSVLTKFVQWRILTHGYACIRGHYDRPDDTGHINHFQALCAALSATIGLGNIAGVAVAVSIGGPGAIFWMLVVGLFGMTLKFMECSLAVMFRHVTPRTPGQALGSPADDAQEVRGGPMWYIQKGLVEPVRARADGWRHAWPLLRLLALLFAAATMISALGQGNMFQGWNVADVLQSNAHIPRPVSAVLVAGLVALVIIGGIRRIGEVAARLVPFMCIAYVGGALVVILLHLDQVPACLALIIRSAFTPVAEAGAFAGVTARYAFEWGLRRALFSNEAGQGSAAMAHAAARTEEPIREGVVAGIGPFVDTLIICLMSALVMLISGTWNRPAIGPVTTLQDDVLIVQRDATLPPRLAGLYFNRLTRVGTNYLAIHTQRGVGQPLEVVKVPLIERRPNDAREWSAVNEFALDLSRVAPAQRAKLAAGQPAHLNIDGAELMRFAFDTTLPGFGTYVVTLGVCLFAFSTMISWSYYGERGAEFLFGHRAILIYKAVFVVFVAIGMLLPRFDLVYNFSDALCGLMVFCNLPAVLLLSPQLLRAGADYFRRLDAGQLPRVR